MAKTTRKQRIPQLKHTTTRSIGWHCSYRDPDKGTPRKKVFGKVSKGEAEKLYHCWLAEHLGAGPVVPPSVVASSMAPDTVDADEPPLKARHRATNSLPLSNDSETAASSSDEQMVDGCMLLVANNLINSEESRVRKPGKLRSRRTIGKAHFEERKRNIKRFLRHLNSLHGEGAVKRITLADLLMSDVESYNKACVEQGHSASTVSNQMQAVKMLIDRAGRPELCQQVLPWNWESRDTYHGKAQVPRKLPSLGQLKKLLKAADLRGKALIWMGIGLGFGQSDLASVCIRHIDEQSYDLRRGKTGVDRYGDTPPFVWEAIQAYLAERAGNNKPCKPDDLLFTTTHGHPLVHGGTDTVKQWWSKLRKEIGETTETLDGFYTLRHLGATEFGSRPGTSISAMKRWLGHSASSNMADVYMRPVTPEHRQVVEFVRTSLASRPDARAAA